VRGTPETIARKLVEQQDQPERAFRRLDPAVAFARRRFPVRITEFAAETRVERLVLGEPRPFPASRQNRTSRPPSEFSIRFPSRRCAQYNGSAAEPGASP
jgi:hypothetical protein